MDENREGKKSADLVNRVLSPPVYNLGKPDIRPHSDSLTCFFPRDRGSRVNGDTEGKALADGAAAALVFASSGSLHPVSLWRRFPSS